MLFVIASCLALLFGPISHRYLRNKQALMQGVDGFIFVSLAGLVLIHILPELIEHGGALAATLVLVGLFGPTLSERLFVRYSEVTHNVTLILGVLGLLLHTLTDGGAIALSNFEQHTVLAIGVVLHRLPVGMAIWWLLRPNFGAKLAWIVLLGMMLLTVLGFYVGDQLFSSMSIENSVYLQAFVTGSILHVVLHQPHNHEQKAHHHAHDTSNESVYAGVGSLFGLAFFFVIASLSGSDEHHHHHSGHDTLLDMLSTVAPWLVMSYLLSLLFLRGPVVQSMPLRWFYKIVGPEAIVMVAILLGWQWALMQAVVALSIALWLSWQNASLPIETQTKGTFLHLFLIKQIERSAPWVLASLILVNLVGHPQLPIEHPLLQASIIFMVILPMRFCHLGAATLAFALHWSEWSDAAVILPLIAAPILNLVQLKRFNGIQSAGFIALVMAVIFNVGAILPSPEALITLSHEYEMAALMLILAWYGYVLVMVGPRQFISKLSVVSFAKHRHEHKH